MLFSEPQVFHLDWMPLLMRIKGQLVQFFIIKVWGVFSQESFRFYS